MSRALVEGEQNVEDGVLEPLPDERNTALRPEENPDGLLSVPTIRPKSPKEDNSTHPALRIPLSPLQAVATTAPTSLTPDAEFRLIEAELANCEKTREALARREAALRERKAEIIRETRMKLDKEVRELTVEDQDEEMDEGLYMRNVQRRVEANLQMVGKNASQATEESQKLEETGGEKVIPVSAPERRRLARLALFKNDPRLG
ncbi:hypothetical protein AG0111_0g842 [Alternaria gaisen]|uniref:Uncharacterized protein n=1 Tax=Alternaria gaisen TaxID=167740 RepID=A0ACB6G0T3_9PLEO|nr:hypothetical protein AG0111_0g842 [Alternaria gaisen]